MTLFVVAILLAAFPVLLRKHGLPILLLCSAFVALVAIVGPDILANFLIRPALHDTYYVVSLPLSAFAITLALTALALCARVSGVSTKTTAALFWVLHLSLCLSFTLQTFAGRLFSPGTDLLTLAQRLETVNQAATVSGLAGLFAFCGLAIILVPACLRRLFNR